MRNPNRMPEVLAKVHELWKLVPDWRLGQLIFNVVGHDPFFIEDDRLIKEIDRLIVQLKVKSDIDK